MSDRQRCDYCRLGIHQFGINGRHKKIFPIAAVGALKRCDNPRLHSCAQLVALPLIGRGGMAVCIRLRHLHGEHLVRPLKLHLKHLQVASREHKTQSCELGRYTLLNPPWPKMLMQSKSDSVTRAWNQ
jgi:hypothetical protein